jgi:hypothetical protein
VRPARVKEQPPAAITGAHANAPHVAGGEQFDRGPDDRSEDLRTGIPSQGVRRPFGFNVELGGRKPNLGVQGLEAFLCARPAAQQSEQALPERQCPAVDLLRDPRIALTGNGKVSACGTAEDSGELSPGQKSPVADKKLFAGRLEAGIDCVDEVETKSTAKTWKRLSRYIGLHRDLGRDEAHSHGKNAASKFAAGMLTRIACHRG